MTITPQAVPRRLCTRRRAVLLAVTVGRMSTSEQIIAVTGASGTVGRLLAARLSAAGARQRLIGRSPDRLPELAGAVRTEPASFADKATMRAAFDGARTAFLVSAHESADRVAEHQAAVDAAAEAGVQRLVYLSFLAAAPDATFTFARDHWHTEQYIRASGLRFTFLRDSFYLAMFAGMTGEDGVIRGPGGDGKVAAIAHEDIAESAARVLLDGEVHDGHTYDLTGPAAIDFPEAAAILSRFTGRTIEYVAETREEAYASRASYGAADWELAGWVSSYAAIATGEMHVVSEAVAHLTGRPPQDLATYLDRNPGNYAHLR